MASFSSLARRFPPRFLLSLGPRPLPSRFCTTPTPTPVPSDDSDPIDEPTQSRPTFQPRPLENGLDPGVYKAILVGKVGQRPVQKTLRSGRGVVLFSVGTGGIRNNRRPLEDEDPREYADRCAVQWHRISIYPVRLAALALKHVQPGRSLASWNKPTCFHDQILEEKHEAQLIDDGMATPLNSFKYGSSEDDFMDSDDTTNGRPWPQSAAVQNPPFTDSKLMIVSTGRMRRELKRRPLPHVWLDRRDPLEPVLLFTRPLDPDKLTAACITQPTDPPIKSGSLAPPYRFHGRIGRGGRIIFDRWNPLFQAPIGHHSLPPLQKPPLPNG